MLDPRKLYDWIKDIIFIYSSREKLQLLFFFSFLFYFILQPSVTVRPKFTHRLIHCHCRCTVAQIEGKKREREREEREGRKKSERKSDPNCCDRCANNVYTRAEFDLQTVTHKEKHTSIYNEYISFFFLSLFFKHAYLWPDSIYRILIFITVIVSEQTFATVGLIYVSMRPKHCAFQPLRGGLSIEAILFVIFWKL